MLRTDSERKSFLITSSIFTILLLVVFLFKFSSSTEPFMQNGGEILIRFGDSTKGRGNQNQQVAQVVENQPETRTTAASSASKPAEQRVVTQNTQQATTVKSADKPNKNTQQQTRQTVSSSTSNALNNILSGNAGGAGDDNVDGNKGSKDGSKYSNSYYGSGQGTSVGGGTSWGLQGRSLVSNRPYKPDCNETGTVVVQVTVNRQGIVTNAERSLKGTTNTAPCLVEPAIKTAKSFRWKPDNNAPASQIGFVVINFKVGG